MVGTSGKILSDPHFIFFNNLTSPDGSVEHTGDNLTGEGEGDDEVDQGQPGRRAARGRQDRRHRVDLRRRGPRPVVRPGAQRVHPRGQPGRQRARSPATTCPRTPPPRPPWSSASCTATAPSGSSARSARATARASRHRPGLRRQRRLTPAITGVPPHLRRLARRRRRRPGPRLPLRRRHGPGAGRDPGRPRGVAVLRQRGRQRHRPGADEPVLAEASSSPSASRSRCSACGWCSRC